MKIALIAKDVSLIIIKIVRLKNERAVYTVSKFEVAIDTSLITEDVFLIITTAKKVETFAIVIVL